MSFGLCGVLLWDDDLLFDFVVVYVDYVGLVLVLLLLFGYSMGGLVVVCVVFDGCVMLVVLVLFLLVFFSYEVLWF